LSGWTIGGRQWALTAADSAVAEPRSDTAPTLVTGRKLRAATETGQAHRGAPAPLV